MLDRFKKNCKENANAAKKKEKRESFDDMTIITLFMFQRYDSGFLQVCKFNIKKLQM